MSILIFFGASFAPKFLKIFKDEALSIILVQVLMGLTMAGTVMFNLLPVSVIIFMAHEFFRGLFKPIKDAYLNDQLPSQERATVVSFEAIAHHIGGGIGLVLSGVVALHFGIALTWIIFGLPLALGSVLIYKFTNR